MDENKLKDQFIAECGENSRKNLKLFPLKDLFPDSVLKDTSGDVSSVLVGHGPDNYGGYKTEVSASEVARNSLGSCEEYRTGCTLGSGPGQVRPWVSEVADISQGGVDPMTLVGTANRVQGLI